ncbi:MAG: hypothetical protein M3O09_07650 [Acidobacteriota bacterium]|jgi:type II secretory pathway pseudopilin PulG|nr:hypothetical protein [Acidobacteriota bacterium]
MILFVALLAIAAVAIAPAVVFQAKRDREEELIHRGVQYSRAVRAYYKKLGRYPTRIEDLESTNNLRFLRKRYKDPVTGQDFKLLRQQDVQLAFSSGAAGLAAAAALGAGANSSAQKLNGQTALLAAASQLQGASPAAAQPGINVNADPQPQPGDSGGEQANAQQHSGPNGGVQAPGSNSGGLNSGNSNQPAGFGSGNATYGGGALVGVASTSKLASIRSFNKKDHYNQWQFIYDPTTDRGGLVMTPNQPPLQNAVAPAGQQQIPGIPTPIEGPTSKPLSPGLQAQPPDQPSPQQPQ